MDCQTVKDRFSSLLEGELLPGKEKDIRDHLLSCSDCQREFQTFEKTVYWLHSVEEVDAPEGFLSGVREKLEERKQRGALAGKSRGRPFFYSPRLKLPMQAVAMVAVLFLVLYVTKMIPVEMSPEKAIEHPKSSLSEEKKAPPLQSPPGKADSKRLKKPEAPAVREERADRTLALKPPSPAPKPEVSQPVDVLKPAEPPVLMEKMPEEELRADLKEPGVPLPEKKADEVKIARRDSKREEKAGTISKDLPQSYRAKETGKQALMQERAKLPPKEIVLKVSDRDRLFAYLHRLTRNLGGNIVQTEENVLLASVPAASFAAFEKELGGLTQIKQPPSPKEEAPLGKLSSLQAAKGEEAKDKEPVARETDQEGRVSIRIRLVQE